jgi:ribosome-associated heat shock protein Hsp15
VVDSTRVDRWLWAVRIFPSRSVATDACRDGRVTINGQPAKASSPVRIGDRIHTVAGDRPRELEVVTVIDKRVGAPVAATCLVDHSPPPPTREERDLTPFLRLPGTGRPTKRDRRQLDRFRSS